LRFSNNFFASISEGKIFFNSSTKIFEFYIERKNNKEKIFESERIEGEGEFFLFNFYLKKYFNYLINQIKL
jgi:hypothetical protein